jgi:hypothetical protein
MTPFAGVGSHRVTSGGEGVDERILEVARSIRPYLPGLIGDEAPEVDRGLVDLLNGAAAGADVGEAVLELLMFRPATHTWAASVLADEQHRPPSVRAAQERSAKRGFSPLPNPYGGDPVDAEKYVCPVDGNFVWWRTGVGEPVPQCPDHPGSTLTSA